MMADNEDFESKLRWIVKYCRSKHNDRFRGKTEINWIDGNPEIGKEERTFKIGHLEIVEKGSLTI